MNTIISFFTTILSYPMKTLFSLTNNYALSVLLIVLFIKVSLFVVKTILVKTETSLANKENKKDSTYIKIMILKVIKGLFSASQLFVVFGLYGVITAPISSILDFNPDTVKSLQQILINSGMSRINELSVLDNLSQFGSEFSKIITSEQIGILKNFKSAFMLGPINLTQKPSITDISFIIPIVLFAFAIIPLIVKKIKERKGKENSENKLIPLPLKIYITLMTFFTPFLSILLPAGVGYYFCISRVIGKIESGINKRVNKNAKSVSSMDASLLGALMKELQTVENVNKMSEEKKEEVEN